MAWVMVTLKQSEPLMQPVSVQAISITNAAEDNMKPYEVRRFSTSVARPFAKLVRPPVQVYGVEGRYATALYSAASKQNKLDQVEKELSRVAQLLKEPKMAASILNPFTKRSVKVKSLNDLTAKEKLSPLTANLINLLAENGRLTSTPAVIAAFSTMMSVHRGEVPCTVTTASALDEATLSELKTVLNSFLAKGQVLQLKVKTDPSIMGGMIVRIGERYVDMSAKTKIQKLSKAMREVF
ncbi:ATP synthase subunit O, mitochondrial [Myotis brandtii]|uniref:ATP synthase peripheral stalk subunit OSCP, mitochondrial n=1 Tax=Myotis brandtii TaxID=109478 RepID=S7P2D5_MYOBR|nr:ATP synthase subunit O, mitochondrial [Myotis brandtii]